MRTKQRLAFLVLVILSSYGFKEGRTTSDLSEQLHFSAEDIGVKHPLVLPKEALTVLARDDGVRDALEAQDLSVDKLPASWFSASKIHLDGPDEIDFIAVGEGPLRGSNVNTFWVFRPSPRGFELILTVVAHDLVVTRELSRGYRNIETIAATAVRVSSVSYRFDGKTYKPRTGGAHTIP